MDNDESSLEEPSRGARLLRISGFVFAGLLVLVLVLYFVASSSAFIKGVVLPRVGKALNAQLTVDDASLSPFSQLTLTKLKLQPTGAEPLVTAERVKVRYSLLSILRGDYVVNELTLDSPVIQIVEQPSGTSNLDALKQGSGSRTSSGPSEGPLRLRVHNVALKNGLIEKVVKAKDGATQSTQLSEVDLNLDQLQNGQPGKLALSASFRQEHRLPPGRAGTNDLVEGKINGSFTFQLDAKLLPQGLSGNARLNLSRTEGAYAELAGLGGNFQADMTPTDVRQLSLAFERGGQGLGRIQASGPLDLSKLEGRLTVQVQAIDRQVLNLFGASHGWDFADSTLNATNSIDLSSQGDVIGAKGQVAGRQLSIRSAGQVSPAIDLDVDYEVSVNRRDQAAVLNKLTISAAQQRQEFLSASLNNPMRLAWAEKSRGMGGSKFQLNLTNLNLAEWQSVLGTNLPSGRLNLQLSVIATNDAKLVTANSTASIQGLSARIGTNQFTQAAISATLDGTLEDFKVLTISQYQADVQQSGRPLLKLSGSGRYDLPPAELSLQANAEVALAACLQQFPIAQMTASNGTARLTTSLTQKNQKQTLTGNFSLAGFTGTYGSYSFQDFQAGLDYNLEVQGPEVQIRSAALSLRKGYADGGNVTVDGTCHLDTQSAQVRFKIVDLNQNSLSTFLAPALGGKKLVSASLSGNGAVQYDPKSETSLKSDLSLTNWVVAEAGSGAVSPNLGGQLQVDGAMRQQVYELRQFLVKLSPTARAKNEIELKAHVDLTATNASPSQLTLQAESVDVTPYYDLFAGAKQTNAAAPKTAPASGPTPAPAVVKPAEPGPVHLPVQQLTANVAIGQFFLRDVVITNLQTSLSLRQGEITFKPQFALNGGPVSGGALLNLGVPGYTYDFSFQADHVPMEPLARSFTTNTPAQYKGDLTAQAQLKGAGTTGTNLQKNLSGNLSLLLTNMNYEIVGQKIKQVLEPVAAVLRVPELTQTPINWVAAKAAVGQAKIDLQQFQVQSQAFYAESHGVVPMADVLTNSPLNLPVNLSLRRSLAEKAKLVPANAPTNTDYTALPTFVTLGGTLGNPKSELNEMVLGGLLLRSVGNIPVLGGKATNILQTLGGALANRGTSRTQTNAPAGTNASPAANLIEGVSSLISGSKKDRASTNAPATNTTAKPTAPNLLDDLLRAIPQKK